MRNPPQFYCIQALKMNRAAMFQSFCGYLPFSLADTASLDSSGQSSQKILDYSSSLHLILDVLSLDARCSSKSEMTATNPQVLFKVQKLVTATNYLLSPVSSKSDQFLTLYCLPRAFSKFNNQCNVIIISVHRSYCQFLFKVCQGSNFELSAM